MKYNVQDLHGGINIALDTSSENRETIQTYIPNYALLVLKTSEEQPDFRILVHEGQEVAEGQVIAQSTSGFKIHAPIPCIIYKNVLVKTPDGYMSQAVIIKLSGYFTLSIKSSDRYHWRSLNSNDIRFLLNEKGVICSVTGQPLSDILMQNQNADTLVINALGQDIFPYREDLLLEQNMLKIIEATAILNKILNFSSIIIAVHNEKAFSADEQKMIEELRIPLELVLFPKKYPQAFPKMISQSLQKAYSKRNMKKILILETRTMIAVYDSVVKNKPYIEQYVYVGGNSLKDSAILKAKIGTPIGSLIAELGGFITKPDVIAINSVMHGPYTLDLDTPVTKNMHAIHALSGHDWRKQRTDICTSCGNCVDYCPENCNPMLMYKFIKYNQPAEKLKTYFDSCIECGVCTYVCPNYVNLQNYFINARKQHHVE